MERIVTAVADKVIKMVAPTGALSVKDALYLLKGDVTQDTLLKALLVILSVINSLRLISFSKLYLSNPVILYSYMTVFP